MSAKHAKPISAYDQQWLDRFDSLQAWMGLNDRTPSQLSTDPDEKSLYSWCESQRRERRLGRLRGDREEMLAIVPFILEGDVNRASAETRLAELAQFHAKHGRLPKTTATEPMEKALASFLIHNLRPRHRRGELTGDLLEQASKIPKVLEIRDVPNQENTLDQLAGYAVRNGHLPPMGGRGTHQENRLASWMRNNIRGNAEEKTPKLRERHEAIISLMSRFPSKQDAFNLSKMEALERYVTSHGHLPAGKSAATEEGGLYSWMAARRIELEKGELQEPHAERLRAVLKYPTKIDYEWLENFEVLRDYAASHDGRLPGSWAQGKVFSWLTVQRREYRKGSMLDWRLDRLLTIAGVIPHQ